MNLVATCANISAPAGGRQWVQPIIVAEEVRLTTATKRALLAQNELYEIFAVMPEVIDA